MGQTYAGDVVDRYGVGDTPEVSNRADEFYEQFLPNMPNLSAGPGLEPYYDNAQRRASEKIRTDMASRGMLGSSATNDMNAEMITNLEAEKANREADYALARAAEDRGWQTTGGNLASSADVSSGRRSANDLSWMSGVGDIAFTGEGANREGTKAGINAAFGAQDAANTRTSAGIDAFTKEQQLAQDRLGAGQAITSNLDAAQLARVNAGAQATQGAQQQQRQRAQDYFANTMGLGNAMSGVMQGWYDKLTSADKVLLDDYLAMVTGAGSQRLANAQYNSSAQSAQDNARLEAIIQGLTAFANSQGG
jgi:hypothetical protein